MKKIPIFIFYEEWHICSLKQNKKMSSFVFLFSKTLESKFCLVQDSFTALVGCNKNQFYFMLRLLFSELLHQMSFFQTDHVFVLTSKLNSNIFWWPVLFYCFLIKSIILFGFTIMCYIWHKISYLAPLIENLCWGSNASMLHESKCLHNTK